MSLYASLARELQEPAKRAAFRELLLAPELLGLQATVAELATELASCRKEVIRLIDDAVRRPVRPDDVKDDPRGIQRSVFEERWQRKLRGYLGHGFGTIVALNPYVLSELLERAADAGSITWGEAHDVRWATVVGRGRRQEGTPVYVVVQVTLVLELGDLDTALRRAKVLGRATGCDVQAVAAGYRAQPGVVEDPLAGAQVMVLVGDPEED